LPDENLYAVGFSLGGNILGRYLSKHQNNVPFKRAICVCPPIDLKSSSINIENKLWGIYSKAMAEYIKETWEKHRAKFRNFKLKHGIDMNEVMRKCKTLWDIDHHFTSKVHGYKDGHHYYENAGSLDLLTKIRIPTLYLYSDDDEMVGAEGMPNG